VLARISGLLSGRGYNVESITAGPTTDPTVTRITLACSGDDAVVEQIKKQLDRLIDVIKVTELTGVPALHRELMLVKVGARGPQRG
jgi:acetolactate synthase I/III small subunit